MINFTQFKIEELLVKTNKKKEALEEWNQIDEEQKKYVLFLLKENRENNKTFTSTSNSSLLYCLGITKEEPTGYVVRDIKSGGLCDIDSDYSQEDRDRVIEYIVSKYGTDKVAQIGTWGTFRAKKAIRDITRTLGYPLNVGDKLCRLYPNPEHGKPVLLKDAIDKVPEFGKHFGQNTPEGEILKWALLVEGRIASFGVHPSGIIISDRPIVELVPLGRGRNDETVTQWDMLNIEEKGLIKFDILGLKNLTVISYALRHIKNNHGIDIDIDLIPLNDAETYKTLHRGDCSGVFQLEASTGIRDLTMKVKPTQLEDLSAICAIYRPGPLKQSIKLENYLKWRAGEIEPEYLHKDLKPILGDTGGWMIYQESALRIAKDIAGFTLVEADNLRKAIGKKKKDEMEKLREKFVSGTVKKGYSKSLGQQLFSEIEAFADYSFNLSHSLCYGVLAYQTAYLKTHYPAEFMAAALTCDAGNLDQMIVYLQECKRLNIPILPPDVNESDLNFTVKDGVIRFGLGAIKNVGNAAVQILDKRKERTFDSFWDFTSRLGILNSKVLESLIYTGALDFTRQNRGTLLLAVNQSILFKADIKRFNKFAETYKTALERYELREEEIKNKGRDEAGKLLKPRKIPVPPVYPIAPDYIEGPEITLRDKLLKEKELLGFFISGHPLNKLKNTEGIKKLKENQERPEQVELNCLISEIKLKETKTKKRMASLKLEDLSGTIESIIFVQQYEKYKDILVPNIPLNIIANVQYLDVEGEEEDVTLVSLIIREVTVIRIKEDRQDIPEISIPLERKYLKAIEKAYKKAELGNLPIKINLYSKNTILSTILGVQDDRAFQSEIYRVIRD